jgi:hypothetical protein
MTDQANVTELLRKLLDERYEAGVQEGYARALSEIEDFVKGRLPPDGEVLADHPGDANDAGPPGIIDCQPRYLRRAYEYLVEHPGVTAHFSEIKNKNAFYTLVRLGLAEKRGSQFFVKGAEARA